MADYVRENPRHKVLVEYTAYGKSPEEIAQITGYAIGYVQAVQRSPLFKTEVAQAQIEIKQNTLRIFAERLADETLPSLTTLTTIRDDIQGRASDRVTAADKLIGRALDLYVPRDRGRDNEKRTTRLVIEGNDLTQLMHAVREADGKAPLQLEATIIEGESGAPCAPRSTDESTDAALRAVTIDELEAQDADFVRWETT